MLLLEEPNIYEYCPPSMKMEGIDAYLDVLKEEFKGPSKKAVQKCEEQIKKDYEVIPFVPKAGITTNFTEYPLKINYDVLTYLSFYLRQHKKLNMRVKEISYPNISRNSYLNVLAIFLYLYDDNLQNK